MSFSPVLVSWCSGVLFPCVPVSYSPGFLVSWFPGLLVSCSPGLLFFWFLDILFFYFPGFLVSWFPGVLVSCSPVLLFSRSLVLLFSCSPVLLVFCYLGLWDFCSSDPINSNPSATLNLSSLPVNYMTSFSLTFKPLSRSHLNPGVLALFPGSQGEWYKINHRLNQSCFWTWKMNIWRE